ncbi:YVTN repeat-like/Quino protein amine dehydrogenase [Leucogyrophana mollusca]|uniref:YVTN repeat-like/Quino protein amine dehydrogenase n=1 Tax=Leucogyrophana mollusca TaxID=85980 RepID=A0ACB8B1Q5_9AGAM|nr:YVTN repeat-like/Quino protein amine dehydrogenase [Leucogyrophana mollusca]
MSTSLNPVEWSGARRASRHPAKVFKGYKGVVSVAYFPDGRRIACALNNRTLIICDVKSGRQDGMPLDHSGEIECIAISPDGRRIASAVGEARVVVWNVQTREVVHEIEGGAEELAYSPDGCWIAIVSIASGGMEMLLWDTDAGKLGREPLKCDNSVFCMAFSPDDGSRIAAGFEGGCFQVIDIATGESVLGPIKGHTNDVTSIVYSPDGRLLVTGSTSSDRSIRVWDSKTGVQVGRPMLGHEWQYTAGWISITADGRRIASGGWDKTVRVWDLETRLQVGDSFNVEDQVHCAAFSPDGRYLVGGGNRRLYLFDTESFAIQGPISRSFSNLFDPRSADSTAGIPPRSLSVL